MTTYPEPQHSTVKPPRLLRRVALLGLSLVVVGLLAGYATSGTSEQIVTSVNASYHPGSKEMVQGRLMQDGKPVHGGVVTVFKRVCAQHEPKCLKRVGRARTRHDGSFRVTFRGPAGEYVIHIRAGGRGKAARLHTSIVRHLRPGSDVFVDAHIAQTTHGLVVLPVLFNY